MLYAELGRKPIDMHIKSWMIVYWMPLVNSENSNKFYRDVYDVMLAEYNKTSNG